ncbi:hypothetical protein WNY37_16930 [Henriciella sp. AS95]|uniref:hypothetical protein n=1 Tax=Henriciella sp. AS95 TaxID=3135782 RepID=UPI003170321A
MILRRLTTAFRKQDWFTVAVETLIVVFGVFLGLQVQQWTLERARKDGESAYLIRLHGETVQLLDRRASYDQSRTTFSADLVAAVRVLQDTSAGSALSQAQCDAIAGSSHTTVPPVDLPTITELLSTGRLDQISSQAMRTSILNLTQDAASARDLIQLISEENQNLGRAFPALMRYELGAPAFEQDDYWLSPDCDTDGMRADPAFLNALIDNTYMYNVYTGRGVLPVSQRVKELHDVLDETLGITHASEAGAQP